MLKTLSLSVSLAIALGACSLSIAGDHGKSLPSPQGGVAPTAQSVPSAQSIADGCGDVCAPAKKKCNFLHGLSLPKCNFSLPKCEYTYEWCLKKKKVWHWNSPFGHKACGSPACDSCGTALPSGQSWGSGQSLGTSQIPASFGAPQGAMSAPAAPAMEPAAVPAAPTIPAAPTVPPTVSNGGGLNLLPAGN